MCELRPGNYARVSGYESLNGEMGKVLGTSPSGDVTVEFVTSPGVGWFRPEELTKINNPDLWF